MQNPPIPPMKTAEAIAHMKNGGKCRTQYNHEIEWHPHKNMFYISGGATFEPYHLEPEELEFWELRDTKARWNRRG